MIVKSPTVEGFRVLLRQPALGMAEISWRWSMGAAACLLFTFTFLRYLRTLPVSNADLLLLRTRQPFLISQAIAHIFRGSGLRLVVAMTLTLAALALGWILTASLARAAALQWLVDYFRTDGSPPEMSSSHAARPIRALTGLNFLRVSSTVAAAVGCVGATILAGLVSSPANPQPGLVFLLFVPLIGLVWLSWSVLNWFLSLAPVFVAHDNQDTFSALASAVHLCRERMGAISAVGFWFGLAHVTAFVLATSVVAFPLALAGALPAGVVLGGVLLTTLLYFAVVDFLYAGRLAAYLAIVEFPPPPPAPVRIEPIPPLNTNPLWAVVPPVPAEPTCPASVSREDFDPEDNILSDVPLKPDA